MVAVRGDRRKHLQENLDRAAEAADNGNVDKVYKLLKTVGQAPAWSSPARQAEQWPKERTLVETSERGNFQGSGHHVCSAGGTQEEVCCRQGALLGDCATHGG